MALSVALRRQVRLRADARCEYCHSPEKVSAARFEVDHTHPRSLGGSDDFENLALACQRCNGNRYNFIQAADPLTKQQVALFNPRVHQWAEHFQWSQEGCYILGTSAIGRATVVRLDMNDELHNDAAIVEARAAWIGVGWHPPKDDPRQSPLV
jgi:HNH endonuclease